RESEKRYRYEKEYLDNIFENSADAIAIVDRQGRFTRWNKRAVEMFGYSTEEMQGKHFSEFYADPKKMQEMIEELKAKGSVHAYEIDFIKRDGTLLPCSISISVIRGEEDRPMGSITIVRDLSQWKEAQRKLQEMSFHDALTGLYNRLFFEEEMNRLADDRHAPVGIIICDVDGLKLVNDTMGHHKGDELLKSAAKILGNCFRKSDIVARIGGDEFAVLLPESDENTVRDCCKRIRSQMELYNQENPEVDLSLSIGHAVKSRPTVDMKELFKQADDAMYREKFRHKSRLA
ncbi:MAG: sensor domain-containing diguanylate cyclase, partial [Desulfosalsimonas sp.]